MSLSKISDISKISDNINSDIDFVNIEHFFRKRGGGGLGRGLGKGLRNLGRGLGGGLRDLGRGLGGGLRDLGRNFGSALNKLNPLNLGKLFEKLVASIKNPIMNKFRSLFNLDHIFRIIEKSVQNVKSSFERKFSSIINGIRSSINKVINIISSSVKNLVAQIPKILNSIKNQIDKLYKLFINIGKQMIKFISDSFSKFGSMLKNIFGVVIKQISDLNKKVIDVFSRFVRTTQNLIKPLTTAGSEIFKKYIVPGIKEFTSGFLIGVNFLYRYIRNRISKPNDDSFFNCLPVMLNQTDDILWNISPNIIKLYLKNQQLKKPQCVKPYLIQIKESRVFIQNNKVISVCISILGYLLVKIMIEYITNTSELIPNYALFIIICLMYMQYTTLDNSKNQIIRLAEYSQKILPKRLLSVYKTNYTLFIIGILLGIFELKLIYDLINNYIYNKLFSTN